MPQNVPVDATINNSLDQAIDMVGQLNNIIHGCVDVIRGATPEPCNQKTCSAPACIEEKLTIIGRILGECIDGANIVRGKLG